jgi:hypothetical protein
MSKKEFHSHLLEYMHREPFLPFVVKLRGGREIVIKQPPVVWDDGAASFIDPTDDMLVEFYHNDVRKFELLQPEMSA